ncbi:MAG: flagellar protein FlaG [Acidobacteria bacterium]|nr:flagellar protein FlaG [Acidobacteriota bacterium]
MSTTEIQGLSAQQSLSTREGPQGNSPEQAAKNRELLKAIRTINEGGAVGPSSEVRFAFDRETGQPLIKIVDRVTNEVITQVPREVTLRAAEILEQLRNSRTPA